MKEFLKKVASVSAVVIVCVSLSLVSSEFALAGGACTSTGCHLAARTACNAGGCSPVGTSGASCGCVTNIYSNTSRCYCHAS